MPRSKTSLSKLGAVRAHKNEYRAHLSFLDESSTQKDILAPSRTTEEQAQKDLEQIRKASQQAETREEGLEMMCNEAQKLKDSAKYEAEIMFSGD